MKRGILCALLRLFGYEFVIDVVRQRVVDYNGYKLYQWPDGGIAIYDPKGRRLIAKRFDEILPMISAGIILVRRYDRWGAYNLSGMNILRVEWAEVKVENGYLVVKEANRRGYKGVFDCYGDVVVEPSAYRQISVTQDSSVVCITDYGQRLRFQR